MTFNWVLRRHWITLSPSSRSFRESLDRELRFPSTFASDRICAAYGSLLWHGSVSWPRSPPMRLSTSAFSPLLSHLSPTRRLPARTPANPVSKTSPLRSTMAIRLLAVQPCSDQTCTALACSSDARSRIHSNSIGLHKRDDAEISSDGFCAVLRHQASFPSYDHL